MKNNRGFTLLEVCIVTIILGIMAVLAIVKYSKAIAANELEKAANGLYLEIRSTRALAFKYDALAMVKFIPSAASTSVCSIYVDKNENGTRDAGQGECVRVHQIRQPVSLGVCSDAPAASTYPHFSDGNEFTPTGANNTWKTLLTVDGADSRGEFSHGAVCLKTSRLPKTMYCIGITIKMQSVEFWKYDGTWHKL